MPSDASVYNLLGQGVTPLLNPLDIQAKRNALALGQLQLQQLQRQMSDEAATRAAMQQYYAGAAPAAPAAPAVDNSTPGGAVSVAPGMPALPDGSQLPGAAPYVPPAGAAAPAAPGAADPAPAPVAPPPTPTMADLIRAKVPPAAAAGLVASFQKLEENAGNIRKAQAEADKANGELDTSVKEYGADAANAIIKSNYNPAVISFQLQHFSSLGKRYAQMAAGLVQQIQANPSQMPALFQSMADAGKGNREAAAAEMTAGARRDEVANQTRLGDQTIADKQKADLSALLGTAANQNDWNRILANAKPAAVAALNVPAAFSPAARDAVVRAGTTPEQQITAAETAKRDDNTNRNERARVALDGQRVAIEQQRFNRQYGAALAQLSPADQAISKKLAVGDFNPAQLGRMPNKEAIIAGAIEINPSWTPMAFETKESFTNPEKTQAKNLATISRIVGHIGRFESNSPGMGFAPLYAGGHTFTGGQSTLAEDAHAISAELEKLAAGGVGTQTQVKEWENGLHSPYAGARQKAVDEISQLVGSQYEGMAQQYRAGVGQDLPIEKFVTPAGQAWMKAKGINVSTSPAAPAPAAGGAPKVDLSKVPTDQLLKALGQ